MLSRYHTVENIGYNTDPEFSASHYYDLYEYQPPYRQQHTSAPTYQANNGFQDYAVLSPVNEVWLFFFISVLCYNHSLLKSECNIWNKKKHSKCKKRNISLYFPLLDKTKFYKMIRIESLLVDFTAPILCTTLRFLFEIVETKIKD